MNKTNFSRWFKAKLSASGRTFSDIEREMRLPPKSISKKLRMGTMRSTEERAIANHLGFDVDWTRP